MSNEKLVMHIDPWCCSRWHVRQQTWGYGSSIRQDLLPLHGFLFHWEWQSTVCMLQAPGDMLTTISVLGDLFPTEWPPPGTARARNAAAPHQPPGHMRYRARLARCFLPCPIAIPSPPEFLPVRRPPPASAPRQLAGLTTCLRASRWPAPAEAGCKVLVASVVKAAAPWAQFLVRLVPHERSNVQDSGAWYQHHP